jgi:hypothetical protein
MAAAQAIHKRHQGPPMCETLPPTWRAAIAATRNLARYPTSAAEIARRITHFFGQHPTLTCPSFANLQISVGRSRLVRNNEALQPNRQGINSSGRIEAALKKSGKELFLSSFVITASLTAAPRLGVLA